MKLKKIYVYILSIALFASLLCGCNKKVYITTGLKSDEIFKLSGEACSLGQMMLVLMTEKNRYEEDFGNDIWSYENKNLDVNLEEQIKDKVKKQVSELKTIELFAKENKIQFSDDEVELIKKAAKKYFDSLSKEEIELLKLKEIDVEKLYSSFYYADKVYSKLTKDISLEVSDEEARVIKCKYVFINASENKEQAKLKAEEVKKLLLDGNDFNSVAKKYSDGENNQVQLSRDSVTEEFADKLFALAKGEFTNIIENQDGYYIFLCVEDYLQAETEANKLTIAENYKREKYEKLYKPFEAEQTFEFNDKVWDKVKLDDYSEVVTQSLYDVYNEYFK